MNHLIHSSACLPLLTLTFFVMISSLSKGLLVVHNFFISRYGVECDAVILSIELLNAKNTGPIRKIKLCVQVQPNLGRRYVAECDQTVTYIHPQCFQTGRRVRIKYDPRCPKKVLILS
jgi:hypothetical protein